MELKQYFLIVRRWAWLLILGLLVGAAGGFYGSSYQTPVYQASTRLLVMRPPLEQSSDMTYYSDLQLVQTYIQLLTTQPVLDGASARLGYPVTKSQIAVKQNQETQIIVLTVEDHNPQHAADIANVLLDILVEQNESLQTGRYASTEESIRAQIAQVESQINTIQTSLDQISTQSLQDQLTQVETQIKPLQEEVSQLQQEIAALEASASAAQAARRPDQALITKTKTQIAEKKARIDQIKPLLDLYQQIYSNLVVLGRPGEADSNAGSRQTQLQSTLDLYQSLYLNLLNSLETIRLARLQNTPNIVQIEPAAVPQGPVRPRPLTNSALAAAVGLMLAVGIIFLVEYLDDTLKTPEDVERALGLPVLGFVAQMRFKKRGADEVFVARQPRSPVTEAFRTLRTNLEFVAVEKPICTILVTSPGSSEGKTTVAANLAAIFSQAKKQVLLLDADMRRPRIHRVLGLTNRSGLSNLFLGKDQADRIGRNREDLPNLLVVTSGGLPPNPAELLGSAKMDQILNEFRKHVEVVIIDTPPSLVADAQILAGKVDAVLLVIQPGKTHVEAAKACLETLNRSGARIVGVVMNRIPRNRSYYYGGYKYYASTRYYSSKEAEHPVPEPARRGVPGGAPGSKPVGVPMPAQGPVSALRQKGVQTQIHPQTGAPGGNTVQGATRSTAAGLEPDPKRLTGRTGAESEPPYPQESFLGLPSVHKLFENVDVAPNAAPLQAAKQEARESRFRWAAPGDNTHT